MVICLEQGADLHIAQLMPLPLTVSCFSKIQIGFTFLVPAHLRSPGKRAVKRVCVLLQTIYFLIIAAKSEKFHFRFSTQSQHFITRTPFCGFATGPRWVQIAPGTRWGQIALYPAADRLPLEPAGEQTLACPTSKPHYATGQSTGVTQSTTGPTQWPGLNLSLFTR